MPDTFTSNYNLTKPEVGASRDTWGPKHNANLDTIDGALKTVRDTRLPYNQTTGEVTHLVNFTVAVPQIGGKPMATKEYIDAAIDTAVKARLPSGVIAIWKGTIASIPAGWVLCDGENGTPNLLDKFVIGVGNTYGNGSTGGSSEHNHGGTTAGTTLSIAQMPVHTHSVSDPGHVHGVADPGHSHVYYSSQGSQIISPGGTQYVATVGQNYNTTTSYTGIGINGAATGISLFNNGGGQSHAHAVPSANHLPPYYALCYIMKL